ncbi:Ribonuclease R [bioreactor metagenome]|uniref:Ribonuclease R n=1 Tax=bioreactor metagenome TaxID=1076179 RepID=A0A644ZTI5_9ZZZZ
MRGHLGEEYSGVVTAVTTFGIFVTLDELYVEGLVHITELGGEYFKFDEVRQELRGERTGIRYAIGARVRVQVSRVDLDGRKIDFRLVRDDLELSAGASGKSRGGVAGASRAPSRPDDMVRARGSDSPRAGKSGRGGKGDSRQDKSARGPKPASGKSASRKSAGKGRKAQR